LDWLTDDQIVCSDQGEFTQRISPVQVKGGIKAIMLPLSKTKIIVIESRRAIGIDKNISKSGALIYVVDSTKQSGFAPIQIYPSDLAGDQRYLKSPRTQGESLTLEGYTISVTNSDSTGDTILVKRNN